MNLQSHNVAGQRRERAAGICSLAQSTLQRVVGGKRDDLALVWRPYFIAMRP
jgi:hypothetical protein